MAVVSDDEAPSEGFLDIFLNTISMHGLNHLHSSFHLYHRLLWTLALLVCVSALIAGSSEHICYLISYPILINLQMVMTKELVFPAVTLCKLQKMHKDSMDPFGSSPPDNFSWVGFPILAVPSRPDIIDMVIKCTFRGNNCTTEDFTPVFTRYGKCYTFNADKNNPKVTRQGGMGNGLEIMLDIQQEDYLPIWRETNETSFEAGIRVQIHSQDEPPYIHQLGFGVSPGFQTFVSCQEQRLTYLPKPWGNCRASIPGEQVLTGYSTYSISACRLQCEKEAVVKHCACRMAHMPGNETVCSPNLYIDCADHTLDTLIGETSETCTCPTPCNLTRYGKEISMVRIPHKGSASYLARKYKKNETYIRDNFLVLDIFFEALNYETIEQKKAYDLASLLGDIGGQMGLFIGASFLTVLEILDYLYEVIRDKFNRVLKRKPSPAKKPTENISTLVIDDMKEQSSCEARGRHPEGAYATTMLPNHHRHYTHHGVFEDFAC